MKYTDTISLKSALFCSVLRNVAFGAALVGAAALSLPGNAHALTFTTSYDSPNDASGGNPWEIYSIGYATDATNLYIDLKVNYQFPGPMFGGDTYSGNTALSPGDIYINKNGSRLNNTGSVFGLAVSTHSGDMTADPSENGLPWSAVVQGNLYGNAVFATGTYEAYNGADQLAEDGGNDPAGKANNIPTLIAGYGSDLGAQGLSITKVNGGSPYQVNPNGTMRSNVWSIYATVSLSALGLSGSDTFEIWWAPECGNDTHYVNGSIPEPATLGLLGAGIFGAGGFLRRKKGTSVDATV